jgi:PAS domain S-box-containing protein
LLQPWPLRAYLFAFGCALILPGLLFAALGVMVSGSYDRAAQNRAALETVRALRNDLDRQFAGMVTTLRALATSEALEQGDFASFYRQAKRVLLNGENTILLRDLTNRQLLNTRVPWGTQLQEGSNPKPAPELAASGAPWVSDLFIGPLANRPLYSVNLPVVLADGRKLILSISAPATSLIPTLRESGLPPSWEAGISDRNHRVLALSKPNEGLPGFESVDQTDAPEGVWTTTDPGGQQVLRAQAKSELSGWTVATWVPMSVMNAPYRQSMRFVILGGAGLLALSLILATLSGRMMARPIKEISQFAAKLGRGESLPPTSSYPLLEANAVSEALHEAGLQLKERQEAFLRHEARIREAHERMTLALDVTGLGAWDRDLVTNRIVWTDGMYRIFGRRHEEFHGTPDEVLSYVHPDDRAMFRRVFEETVQGKTSRFGQEFRIVRPDGEVRWVLRRAQVIRSDDGRPVSMLGVALDITERRDREDRISFLLRELAHRSKNLVAVIQAIAHQTARYSDDISDLTERFSARLVSLARTQDLLTGRSRKGAVLEDLVHAQIEPFIEGEASRLSVKGPPIVLDDTATQNIGLAFHELATNASKYGALSVPQGRIAIEWSFDGGTDGSPSLLLTWRERNGPTVRKPARKGFGHVVIERTLADSLQCDVKLDFAPRGLTWEVRIPHDHFYLLERSAAEPTKAAETAGPADKALS